MTCRRSQCQGRRGHSFANHWTPVSVSDAAYVIGRHRATGRCQGGPSCNGSLLYCLVGVVGETARWHSSRFARP